MTADVTALTERLDALEAKARAHRWVAWDPAAALRLVEGVRQALALHERVVTKPPKLPEDWCAHDIETFPCPTVRALGYAVGVSG